MFYYILETMSHKFFGSKDKPAAGKPSEHASPEAAISAEHTQLEGK
jgi:hypothetical protein